MTCPPLASFPGHSQILSAAVEKNRVFFTAMGKIFGSSLGTRLAHRDRESTLPSTTLSGHVHITVMCSYHDTTVNIWSFTFISVVKGVDWSLP